MKAYILSMGVLLTMFFSACKKNDGGPGGSCSLPSTSVPSELVGNWASGYNSSTDILDAYSGQYLGNAFQSGKYFHFENDGQNAEFYYMVNGGTYSSAATRAIGTVEFLEDHSFIFHACKAHYKGWQNGALRVDRDATNEEIANGITRKYYYSIVTSADITYMQITFSAGDEYGTSFSRVP